MKHLKVADDLHRALKRLALDMEKPMERIVDEMLRKELEKAVK